MTSTLTTVPLAKIKPREGFNPRSEFADEQMAEASDEAAARRAQSGGCERKQAWQG